MAIRTSRSTGSGRRTGDYYGEHLPDVPLLADPAAIFLSNLQARERAAHVSETLKGALHTRSLIDMAKGMLMERLRVSEHGALQVMITRSRTDKVFFSDVARDIIDPSTDPPSRTP